MTNKEDSKKKTLPPQTSPAGVAAPVAEESSESENETEPARIFQRRVSTSKTLNGSVSIFLFFLFQFFFLAKPSGPSRIGQMLRPNVPKSLWIGLNRSTETESIDSIREQHTAGRASSVCFRYVLDGVLVERSYLWFYMYSVMIAYDDKNFYIDTSYKFYICLCGHRIPYTSYIEFVRSSIVQMKSDTKSAIKIKFSCKTEPNSHRRLTTWTYRNGKATKSKYWYLIHISV